MPRPTQLPAAAAVDGYTGEHPHNGTVDPPPFAGGFSLTATVPATNKGPFPFEEERLAATLAAFTRLARSLGAVRGEKSLLWVTGGFLPPEDHRDIEFATRALANSNVILFPIDARGLVACLGGACPPEVNLAIASMDEVAQLTGGRAFHDDNGIAALARAALDDSREGYVLTYTPNNYKEDGSVHKVLLRTSRKGVELRYRPGYIQAVLTVEKASARPSPNPPGVEAALPPRAQPEFEVATVRLANGGSGGSRALAFQAGGRVTANGMPPGILVEQAWNLSSPERAGGAAKILRRLNGQERQHRGEGSGGMVSGGSCRSERAGARDALCDAAVAAD